MTTPTIFDFPAAIAPTTQDNRIRDNTAVNVSPLNGFTQTSSRDGTRWIMKHLFQDSFGDDRADLIAFLLRLNGKTHRAKIRDHSYHGARGALGGTPLVDGASQSGTTLDIKGMTPNITDIFKGNDQISFENTNGVSELKTIVAAGSSDGAGLVTVEIWPEIHTSPANSEPIITTNPAGVFMLVDPETVWSNINKGNQSAPIHSNLSINWMEDLR